MVTIERNLIISLLKLTKNGTVSLETVKTDSKMPLSVCKELLQKLQRESLLYLNGDNFEVDTTSRLKLAVKAAELGSDVERLSDYLSWQEFEGIATVALERNGYSVAKNVRFKHNSKRWEIDVVGCRKPIVVCIDCKHWHHGMHPSTLRRMAEAQARRVEAFADTLPNATLKIECLKWSKAKVFPIILSLLPTTNKFYDDVPVVPVFQLQDCINQLPLHVDSLKQFPVCFNHL